MFRISEEKIINTLFYLVLILIFLYIIKVTKTFFNKKIYLLWIIGKTKQY